MGLFEVFIRWFSWGRSWIKHEPQSHGADMVWMRQHGKHFAPRYHDSYRVTANFLNWVSEKYDHQIGEQMNAAMREGNYNQDLWKIYTGKSLSDLGNAWQKLVEAQISSNSVAS